MLVPSVSMCRHALGKGGTLDAFEPGDRVKVTPEGPTMVVVSRVAGAREGYACVWSIGARMARAVFLAEELRRTGPSSKGRAARRPPSGRAGGVV